MFGIVAETAMNLNLSSSLAAKAQVFIRDTTTSIEEPRLISPRI